MHLIYFAASIYMAEYTCDYSRLTMRTPVAVSEPCWFEAVQVYVPASTNETSFISRWPSSVTLNLPPVSCSLPFFHTTSGGGEPNTAHVSMISLPSAAFISSRGRSVMVAGSATMLNIDHVRQSSDKRIMEYFMNKPSEVRVVTSRFLLLEFCKYRAP